MKRLILSLCVLVIGIGGCAPTLYQQTVLLPSSRQQRDFVFYSNQKGDDGVDHKGVTVWDKDGKLVYGSDASGKSLIGIGVDALIAAPLYGIGAAAVVDYEGDDFSISNENTNKNSNRQKQGQNQKQYQKQGQRQKVHQPKCRYNCRSY